MSADTTSYSRSMLIGVIAIILSAGILRYAWIVTAHPWDTVAQFQERYVYSDMLQYWIHAQKFWVPAAQWSYADTLYPPGTGIFFAFLLGPDMDRIHVWQAVEWLQAMWIAVGTGLLGFLLSGRRTGIIALGIAAFSFSLFDYSAYFLSETPFTATLLTAVLCMTVGFKHKHPFWFLLAGVLLGVSATFKSIGLLAGALLLPIFFLAFDGWKLRLKITSTFLCCTGLLVVLIPTAALMTQRNNSSFLLLSHDVLRMAMANHGDVRGVEATLPDGGHYTITSPVGIQKDYQEIRFINLQTDNVIAENIQWVATHPLRAIGDFLRRFADLFFGTLPFPTVATPFSTLLFFSQLFMLLVVYVPAAIWLLQIRSRFAPTEKTSSLLLILPLGSLVISAAIAATEPRYLHPFAPLLIVCASMWYAQIRHKHHSR